jgi:hypothetical protein
MFETLRGSFRSSVPNDSDFEDIFDRFEYLLALRYASERTGIVGWGPIGRFAHRYRYTSQHISKILNEEYSNAGASWGPIAQGLFDEAGYQGAVIAMQEILSRYWQATL